VGYLFQFVADAKAAERTFSKSKSDLPGSHMLQDVGRMVARLIEREGKVEAVKVEEASTSFGGFAFEKNTDTRKPSLVPITTVIHFDTITCQASNTRVRARHQSLALLYQNYWFQGRAIRRRPSGQSF
jgi:hypothetical protein